ncbi:LLM class flavin-dependent oxidoreductase [Aldersonia kunmingensis]|uniref:LLM class flavin-dependent oxidoreductase n=1 Tax=Aldersonia kunmingensis TaxID=408066 RepID=UPI00082DE5FD|nr:LLM class flavin-dependent oxidoreductase [Aldersonia kunmingensis]
MGDYGHEPRFGVFANPAAESARHVVQVAEVADGAGLDLIGVQDHPYQRRFLDAFALMTTLLARTERISVFPDVACLPLRPPAVMAKTAATLDILSGGRFILGLGAGGFWDAIEGFGGPRRSPGDAATALIEATDVARAIWSTERSVTYDGQVYQLAGIHPGPPPEHGVPIWWGVLGPRMLSETGRHADGWVPSASYFPPEKLAAGHARIDDGAAAAGREPSEIRRVYNVFGSIPTTGSKGFLNGPVGQWIDELTELVVDGGMDTFIFGTEGDDLDQIRKFAAEVVPAVREAVARERG